jgi:amino acid adenylation domain-containing protein
MSWAERLVQTCRLAGAAVAVIDGAAARSYAELDTASAHAAGSVAAAGVRPGDVVAVVAPRSWWRCAVILGIWRAGAAVFSADPSGPAARTAAALDLAGARLALRPPGAEPLASEVRQAELGLTDADLATGEPLREVRHGPVGYVVATSGTTGVPKCAELPAAVLPILADWHARCWPHQDRPATLHLAPVGFDVGYQEMVTAWAAAAPLIVVDDITRRDPYRLLPLIRDRAARRAFLSVSALQSLVIAASIGGQEIPALRQIFVSGEQLVINDEVRASIGPGTRLINQYGPSETHVVTEHWLPADPATWPVHPPIGTPPPWAELMTAAGPVARPFRAGEEAELAIAGPTVAAGYRRDPDLTARKFRDVTQEDGTVRRCYLTGDRVRFDGTVYHFIGRTDDQLKIRGFRVEPGEVEQVLNSVPGVARAAVVGIRGRDSLRLAAAIVALPGGGRPDDRELADACRAALPDYMVPASFTFIDELPLSVNGKIVRHRVAELLARPVPAGGPDTLCAPGTGPK